MHTWHWFLLIGVIASACAQQPPLSLKPEGRPIQENDTISSAIISSNGTRIITAGPGTIAQVWSVTTHQRLTTLRGHKGEVVSVAMSHNGKYLATISLDNTVRIWDSATGKTVRILHLRSALGDPQPYAVAYAPDLFFSPTDKYLYTCSEVGLQADIWDVGTGKIVHHLPGDQGIWLEPILDAAFSPDGKRIVTAHRNDHNKKGQTALVWDIQTGKAMTVFHGQESRADSIAYAPNGKHIATGYYIGQVMIWNASTGQAIYQINHLASPVEALAYSPDGRLLAGTGRMDSAWTKIWEARTGKELYRMSEGGMHIHFSPDGKRVILSGERPDVLVYRLPR